MLIEEIIYRVKTALDDKKVGNTFSNAFIFNKILSVRARLLSEDIKKKHIVSDTNYQVIEKKQIMEMKNENNKTMYKVDIPFLPKTIIGYEKESYTKVIYYPDRFKEVYKNASYISSYGKDYIQYNSFTKGFIRYFIEGGNMYLINISKRIEEDIPIIIDKEPVVIIPAVKIVGLFENPLEVFELNNTKSDFKILDFMKQIFPFDHIKTDILISLILEEANAWLTNINNNEKREMSQ